MAPPGKNKDPPPPRGQKSLTSFFGAARSKKTGEVVPPRKVQTGIKGGLKKQAAAAAQAKKKEEEEDTAEKKKKIKVDDTSHDEKEEEEDVTEETAEKENMENGDERRRGKGPSAAAAEKPTANMVAKKEEDLTDTDDEGGVIVAESTKLANKKAAAKKPAAKAMSKRASAASRKRVIEEDSEEEDADEDEEEAADDNMDEDYNEEERPLEDDDGDSDDDTVEMSEEEEVPLQKLASKKSTSKTANRKSAVKKEEDTKDDGSVEDESEDEDEEEDSSPLPKNKKQKTLTGRPAPQAIKPTKSASGSKSEAAAKAMKSNAQLLVVMESETVSPDNDKGDKTWAAGKPTPYSALCDVFCEIEAISGRLEIQERLCTFFRKVLLRDGGGDECGDDDENDDDDIEGGEKEEANGEFAAKEIGCNGKKDERNAGGEEACKETPIDRSSDLYALLYLASNSVAPQHLNVELGVGDSILIKAIGEASGTAPAMIKKRYEKEGDLGTVAQTSKGRQRTLVGFGSKMGPKRLTCGDVLKVFKEIANTSGSQSQKWKVDKIKSLLVRAKGSEPKYIIRGLQGKLRIGLAQSTVLASLAHAAALTRPKGVKELDEARLREIRKLDGTEGAYPDSARKLCCPGRLPLETRLEAAAAIVKKAYVEVPSYDSLLDALLNVPLQEVHKGCTLTPGIPVVPMLAKPTKSVLDVLKRLNGLRFTCEYKYDGERAQVHMLPNGDMKVFSRNLLNTTEKFPEVPLYVQESCKETSASSFVLDTEVVAFNRETGQFVPFQVLSTRKRAEESAETAKVQVIVQAFDLMYLNGKSLLDRTLAERRRLMKENFLPIEGKFQYATSIDHTENGDTAVVEEFLNAAIKGQCEGLMVKTLDENAVYEPDRRSLNWLKLKKDYLDGLGDSVDLVPLGAYHGKGKRTGVYGAYLLACYDVDTEEFQSVCKIGTGFSEDNLKSLASALNSHVISEKSSQYNVSDSLEPDVWFDAVQVWEVKAADLSKSSTHRGAIDKTGESGRGIGLRFPRFERVRPDKRPEDATSSDQILEMYYAQDSIVGGDSGGMDEDGI